jgi:hypothetical protein
MEYVIQESVLRMMLRIQKPQVVKFGDCVTWELKVANVYLADWPSKRHLRVLNAMCNMCNCAIGVII